MCKILSMKIIRDLNNSSLVNPVSLTIGNFDGVHLGHQYLLKRLTNVAKEKCGQSVVVSFENHPKSILFSDHQSHSICTLAHKIKALAEAGVDILVLLQFTSDLKEKTAENFLDFLHKTIPFSYLVLGYDSIFGKNRQGTKERVLAHAKEMNIEVEYIEPLLNGEKPISSSLIRKSIQKGDLQSVENLLGRKYSIFGKVITGDGKGKVLGFPTANIDVSDLNLPPLGVYAVAVEYDHKKIKGIANLGVAPTMRDNKTPLLEIHLLESQEDLYGKDLNVIFYNFIRPEMKFSSIDDLKQQIHQDIQIALSNLKLNHI